MGQSITVPDEIYTTLETRAADKGFETTDEYVEYVLQQVADKIKRKHGDSDESEFSQEDEEKVKERLRNLGYLD